MIKSIIVNLDAVDYMHDFTLKPFFKYFLSEYCLVNSNNIWKHFYQV